jgi:hypothetical protein
VALPYALLCVCCPPVLTPAATCCAESDDSLSGASDGKPSTKQAQKGAEGVEVSRAAELQEEMEAIGAHASVLWACGAVLGCAAGAACACACVCCDECECLNVTVNANVSCVVCCAVLCRA